MHLRLIVLLSLIVLQLLVVQQALASSPSLSIKPHQANSIDLTDYLDVLEDTGQALSLTDVQQPAMADRFKSGQGASEAFNFGYSQSAFWLRLRIKNDSAASLATVLEIGKARLSSVQFYYPLPSGSYQTISTGDMMPFSSRAYPNRFFVLPLTLPAQSEYLVYVRVQSDSAVMIPAKLWPEQAFYAYERADYVWQALYFGMAVGAIFFNLLLFTFIRDRSLLLYVAFSASLVFAMAAQNALLAQYLPWHFSLFSRVSAPVGFSLTLVAALLFMRHMLKPHMLIDDIDILIKGLIYINLLMPLGYVISVPAFAVMGQVLNIITSFVIFSVAVICVLRRQRSAYFFVASFTVLFASAVISAVVGLGLLPANFFMLNILQFGSAIEMLLMALSVVDRLNFSRKEKEAAQLIALNAQRQLVDNMTLSERLLEARVQARTAEMRQFMDMLNHELKTPMAVIRLSMEVKSLSPSAKLNVVQSVIDMDSIIERCLQADKLEHQQRSVLRQACNVSDSVAQICAASASPQRLCMVSPAPLVAHTDHHLLRIALVNLIDNALKYSEIDSLVTIALVPLLWRDQAGFQISIANKPGAAGWPDAQQVFSKYYRSPGAHGKSGSGLGLYLVKNITHLLAGNINYCPTESQVKFELWIPL